MANFKDWTTERLGRMIQLARKRAQEEQARFEASQQTERRTRKLNHNTEVAKTQARRVADELELMRAELRRRAVESLSDPSNTLLTEAASDDIWAGALEPAEETSDVIP